MRIVLAGATGVIGRPLTRQLLAAGHEVVGLTRTRAGVQALQAAGADARQVDISSTSALAPLMAGADAVMHQVTALPARIGPRGVRRQLAPTNRLRREGTALLLAAAEVAGVPRFIAQSVAFAYDGGPEGGPRDEDAPFATEPPGPFVEGAAALRSLEGQVRAHPGGTVLRYGLFYGPGSAFAADGTTADDVRRRRVPLVGAGDAVASFVHVEDAAAATVAALAGPPGTYNVVDDEPARGREWLPVYAQAVGAPPPLRVPPFAAWLFGGTMALHWSTRLAGASNARAGAALGWAPEIPSWRLGFALARHDAPAALPAPA
ncbi:MAG: NAD(P)-dependent oxidoreductase [Myxococcota bacterium]